MTVWQPAPPACERARTEAGAATVWVLAGCLLLGLAALVPTLTGRVALARHRAAVAADAAALAAARDSDADELSEATGAASSALLARGCRTAAAVVAADAARLESCVEVTCGPAAGDAASVQVEVRVRVAWPGFELPYGGEVAVLARAGGSRCRP